MSDEQIKQRIAYLVEHGGLFDDPLAEMRRNVQVLFYMTAAACTMGVLGLGLLLME